MLQLPSKLVTDVGQPLEVFASALDAVFGVAPALLVLGDTRCFFDKNTQILRFRLNQPRHHALLNN